MYSLALRAIQVGAALLVLNGVTAAQPATIMLPPVPSCQACTIELTKVVTLGHPDDSVLIGETTGSVAFDSRGRYFAPVSGGFQVGVYDSQGKLTGVMGRRGRGPGEFQMIVDARVGPGDSLFVADARNGILVFGPDLTYARTFRITAPGGYALSFMRDDGSVVMQTSPDQISIFTPTGTSRHTIAVGTTRSDDVKCFACDKRWLARASETGRFWSTISNRYEIQLLAEDGTPHRVLTRRPAWFTPWTSDSAATGSRGRPPAPALYAIRESPDGILWVLTRVADPNWKFPPPKSLRPAATDSTLDVMIAAIDPKTGALLAEHRFPGTMGFVGRSDLFFTLREDQDGYVTAEVWRMRLHRR